MRRILLPLVLTATFAPGCDEPTEPLADELGDDLLDADNAPVNPPTSEAEKPMEPMTLVEAEAWQPSTRDDPLAHERPPTVDCPAAAWGPELGGLEIQTGTCNYFYATQPSLADVEPGDALEVVVFHDRLDTAEPAEGHVALMLGGEVFWDAHVEIPSNANVLEARIIAERSWPAGTPVGLHLHNHGYNAWTMLDLSVVPGG